MITEPEHNHWNQVIPVGKHAAVSQALQRAFGSLDLDDISPITGGMSTALVNKITVHGKHYVLRVEMQVSDLRDPQRQCVCLKAAAAAGIAPSVRYIDTDDAISIVDFIDHTPIGQGFTSQDQLYAALAAKIKATHALPLFPPLVDLMDGLEGLMVHFKSFEMLPPELTSEHFRLFRQVQAVYPRHQSDLVSSHNDLNPGNVLYRDGRIWIIDWEVAFANDRYADLAIANLFFGAAEHGEDVLLRSYFDEELTEYHRARFFLMQQIIFMYYAMIFMHLVADARPEGTAVSTSMDTIRLHEFHAGLRDGLITMTAPESPLIYAKILLNEMLPQMQSARFQEALAIVAAGPH